MPEKEFTLENTLIARSDITLTITFYDSSFGEKKHEMLSNGFGNRPASKRPNIRKLNEIQKHILSQHVCEACGQSPLNRRTYQARRQHTKNSRLKIS